MSENENQNLGCAAVALLGVTFLAIYLAHVAEYDAGRVVAESSALVAALLAGMCIGSIRQ